MRMIGLRAPLRMAGAGRGQKLRGLTCTVLQAAAWTRRVMSRCVRSSTGETGLTRQSTAPRDSAVIVASESARVAPEIITTGIGRNAISRARKSRPFIPGISMSSVTTSGFVRLITSRAICAVSARPTTSSRGSVSSTMRSQRRIVAESSTITTFLRGGPSTAGRGPSSCRICWSHPLPDRAACRTGGRLTFLASEG